MSPFLEHGQIPTGQEAALRMAESLASVTVGRMSMRAVEAGEAPDRPAEKREELCRELAAAMISGCTDAWHHEEKGGIDPLEEYRTLMYVEVGHPNKWWRYAQADSLKSVVGESRGSFRCFSHAVAAMVDWDNNEAVIIANDPYVDDTHGGSWTVRRRNLITGAMTEEEIMQVEKGSDPYDVTLYASPRSANPAAAYNQSPTYYSLQLDEQGRADQVIVSHRVGQPGRGNLVIGAVLTDDIGQLHARLSQELHARGLPPELLTSSLVLSDPMVERSPVAA